MKTFLEEAKKEFWRAGLEVTPEFRARLTTLLLEKLAVSGETEPEDREWAEDVVSQIFP